MFPLDDKLHQLTSPKTNTLILYFKFLINHNDMDFNDPKLAAAFPKEGIMQNISAGQKRG